MMFAQATKIFALIVLASSAGMVHARDLDEEINRWMDEMPDDEPPARHLRDSESVSLTSEAIDIVSKALFSRHLASVCSDQTVNFPSIDNGYFWSRNRGHSIAETFALGSQDVVHAEVYWCVPINYLTYGAYVDWTLSINEIDVGSWTINEGFTGCRLLQFSFSAISANSFDVKARVTNEVPPGAGSHTVDNGAMTTLKFGYACDGGVYDDPHIKRWNGVFYDFMGACDLHLIKAPAFFSEGEGLTIDIRTKIRYWYSYIETAVVKLGKNGKEEVFEVSSFGEYALQGVNNASLPATISGFNISHSSPMANTNLFEIHIGEGERIVLKTFKDMVSVMIKGAAAERFDGSLGLMGDYESGKMWARDGITELTDPNAFGAEWQVRQDEEMIFQTIVRPQHPEGCILPDPATKTGRSRLRKLVAVEDAEKACADWPKDMKQGCIHDVLATGDLKLAAAGVI